MRCRRERADGATSRPIGTPTKQWSTYHGVRLTLESWPHPDDRTSWPTGFAIPINAPRLGFASIFDRHARPSLRTRLRTLETTWAELAPQKSDIDARLATLFATGPLGLRRHAQSVNPLILKSTTTSKNHPNSFCEYHAIQSQRARRKVDLIEADALVVVDL